MINFKIKINNKINQDIDRKVRELDRLPQKAIDFFRAHTPIKSGNARRNTRLKGDTIEARYQYAQRLEDGTSKQAPDGMVKPTEAYIKKQLDTIFRK